MADGTPLWFLTLAAAVLFAVALLGIWLPLRLSSSPQLGPWHALGNCLAGGVMLAAGMCHLLPEAIHTIGFVGRFPLATFLATVGFLATLLSDQVLHGISHPPQSSAPTSAAHSGAGAKQRYKHHDSQRERADRDGDDDDDGEAVVRITAGSAADVELAATAASATARGRSKQHAQHAEDAPLLGFKQHDHHHHHAAQAPPPTRTSAPALTAPGLAAADLTAVVQQPLLAGAKAAAGPGAAASGHTHISVASAAGAGAGGAGGHQHDVQLLAMVSGGGRQLHFATALLLAAALCTHAVLEGMALGAQETMRATQDIMFAIAAHKGLAAYALGSSVVESGANLIRYWTVALIFALATPLAIFIGWGLSEVSKGTGGGALSALASGTFLYVAVMEVIPKELSGPSAHAASLWLRAGKVVALLTGFGLMSLLAIWA